mmetsp:Transcript_106897/g.212274  ORF Transcript_106897/g.212274 Transcript_106897/m.212274 type:complete len:225 (-) Transcript_106897:77-751(-)
MSNTGNDELAVCPSGLPLVNENDKKVNWLPLVVVLSVPLALGIGIAYAIYFITKDEYDKQLNDIASAPGLCWLYLAPVFFGRTLCFVNMYPAVRWKSQLGLKGNIRANVYIFKLIGENAPSNAAVLETDGDVGAYNRSNRSLHHMVENFGLLLMATYMCGKVFPVAALIVVLIFCIGRIMHQIGYTKGYGSHGVGFLLSNVVASPLMEGLCFVIFLQSALKAYE